MTDCYDLLCPVFVIWCLVVCCAWYFLDYMITLFTFVLWLALRFVVLVGKWLFDLAACCLAEGEFDGYFSYSG